MSASMTDTVMVFSVLESACYATDPTIQQAAMKTLQDFYSKDGFVYSLIQVLQSDQIPDLKLDCRLLAVITLKNVVSRCWKTRGSSIHLTNSTEKQCLRDFLLKQSLCTEKDRRVLSQLAVLMGQIAKTDWPTDWSALLPSLFEAIQCNDRESSYSPSSEINAIVFFHAVLSELSAKTIPNARKAFNEASVHIFPYIAENWLKISIKLIEILPLVYHLGLEVSSNALKQHNHLAEQLPILTNILEIIVKKAFLSISTSTDFIKFFESFVPQQYRYIHFLQNIPPESLLVISGSSSVFDINEIFDHDKSEVDIENILIKVKTFINNEKNGEICALLLRICRISDKISSLPIALLKESPLQMVPFLETFLKLSYTQINENFQIKQGVTEFSGDFLDTSLQLTKGPCISAILFLSNTLSCKVYTKETNTVAKKREKLLLSLSHPNSEANQNQVSDYFVLILLLISDI
jgi:hypothetical protein